MTNEQRGPWEWAPNQPTSGPDTTRQPGQSPWAAPPAGEPTPPARSERGAGQWPGADPGADDLWSPHTERYGGQQPYGSQEPYGGQQPYGSQQPYGDRPASAPYGGEPPYGGQPPYGRYVPEPPPRRRRTGRIVAIVAVAILAASGGGVLTSKLLHRSGERAVAACDDKEIRHSLEASDVPAGFTAVRDGTRGFAVAVPTSFQRFDLTQANIDALEKQLSTSPDDAKAVELAKQLMARGAVLFRIDFTTGDNVNVLRTTPNPRCNVPAGLERQARSALSRVGAHGVSTKRITVGGRDSVEVTYTLTGEGGSSVSGTQVYVPADGHMYIVTVTSSGIAEKAVDTIIGSVRIS